jgi:signal-transduction protein with cAMP-binding, CBS, and nucleotidyltransferase domain
MDRQTIERIDVFAYRHRVREMMESPVVTVAASATLQSVTELMNAREASSIVAVDEAGRPIGIMTGHDLLAAVARDGGVALTRPIDGLLSRPVATIAPDAFLHTAIARMDRLGFRHLGVVDPASGRLVGMVTARALLRQRSGQAIALGDDIAAAKGPEELGVAYRRLPAMALGLLGEGMTALEIAEVLSGALRDLSGRAAELAAAAMLTEGQGEAPAPWAFLVLGSAGRGESLLAADQDNALVHTGENDEEADWFAELGRRAADILNAAGLVYCAGGVMAKNRACRHNLVGWGAEVERWIAEREPAHLLNADIFFDFRPVNGDYWLGDELRDFAVPLAARSPAFLARLAHMLDPRSPALSPVFGRFRGRAGRVDLKRGGLRSLVSAARILGLKLGSVEVSTERRFAAAAEAGLLPADDLALFLDAHGRLLRLILEQQLIDIETGKAAGTAIEVRRLPRLERERLKAALSAIGRIDLVVRHALAQ